MIIVESLFIRKKLVNELLFEKLPSKREIKIMSKYLRIIFLLPILTGCVSSTVYNLDAHVNKNRFEVQIKENRKNILSKSKQSNSTYILGDENLIPGPIELISSKLSDYLLPSATKDIKEILLNHFKLIIYWPNMGKIGSSAAMAGASYPAAILYDGFSESYSFSTDGVISQVSLSINGTEYKCSSYLPARDEVSALVGIQMSSKGMPKPLNEVLNRCIIELIEKTPFEHKEF